MSKKKSSRRPNLSAEVLERARAEVRGEISKTIPTTENGAAAAVKAKQSFAPSGLSSRRVAKPEELKAEYAYVLRDLRNLGIIAGSLFGLIIVAALIISQIGF